MLKYAFVSISFLVIAIGLFSIPLILKYYVYKPQYEDIVCGDSLPLGKRFPSLWCEALMVKIEAKFNALQFKGKPKINLSDTKRTISTGSVKLPNKAQEIWRFHFLQGTNVSVSACVKLSGASMSLIAGWNHLNRCLIENEISFIPIESLEEDSEAESDGDTSSISSSQGVVSNETDDPFVCSRALEYSRLESSYRCNSASRSFHRKLLFSHHVRKTGYYYFLFTSDTYLDIIPNDFSVKLELDRVTYDYDSASDSCMNVTECEMPLFLLEDRTIAVDIYSTDGVLKGERMEITCMPRKVVFFMFYLGFAAVIFICAFQ